MGVMHWLFQRTSNLVFVLFGVFLLATLFNGVSGPALDAALSGGASRLFIILVLVLACLNSILAGWQIAGDYAHKINVSASILTGLGAVVSLAYLLVGFQILF